MAGENILAIRLSDPEPGQVLPWNGVEFADGWRAVMAVTMVLAKVQTTVLFGNSLYMIWNNIGSMSPQEGFSFFLGQYCNRPKVFGQLAELPFASVSSHYRMLLPVPPPLPATALGVMTMLNSGFDPLRGYWVEFAGNYFLGFPIFQDWPTVIRDGPNFKGFQPPPNNLE